MAIAAILVFIGMMCVGIYLIAIYALPILAGLAAYSLLKQIDASAPMIAVASIASGLAALVAARAGASARNDAIRLATLVLIAAPAGYAGYSATLQLAHVFGVSEAWWSLLSVIAALAVAVFAIDMVGKPALPAQRAPDSARPQPAMLPAPGDNLRASSAESEPTLAPSRSYARRVAAKRG